MKYMMAGAGTRWALVSACAAFTGGLFSPATQAQNLTVTPAQQATASQVAQNGVPLNALAPNAPDRYTVKSGDTLWAILSEP